MQKVAREGPDKIRAIDLIESLVNKRKKRKKKTLQKFHKKPLNNKKLKRMPLKDKEGEEEAVKDNSDCYFKI